MPASLPPTPTLPIANTFIQFAEEPPAARRASSWSPPRARPASSTEGPPAPLTVAEAQEKTLEVKEANQALDGTEEAKGWWSREQARLVKSRPALAWAQRLATILQGEERP